MHSLKLNVNRPAYNKIKPGGFALGPRFKELYKINKLEDQKHMQLIKA